MAAKLLPKGGDGFRGDIKKQIKEAVVPGIDGRYGIKNK